MVPVVLETALHAWKVVAAVGAKCAHFEEAKGEQLDTPMGVQDGRPKGIGEQIGEEVFSHGAIRGSTARASEESVCEKRSQTARGACSHCHGRSDVMVLLVKACVQPGLMEGTVTDGGR